MIIFIDAIDLPVHETHRRDTNMDIGLGHYRCSLLRCNRNMRYRGSSEKLEQNSVNAC